jgi:hypothetical protein
VDHLISPAEFSTWYTPALTLGLLDRVNFARVANEMKAALFASDVVAAAATLTLAGTTTHHCKIPSSIWRHWNNENTGFWVSGDITFPVKGNPEIVLYGVRFDPAGIARLFPGMIGRQETINQPMPDPASVAKGGRPAGKNGEPIARVAKQLIALTPAELASYTAEAVAAELVAEYRRLKLQPPSPDNAKRDASGILRAVRN